MGQQFGGQQFGMQGMGGQGFGGGGSLDQAKPDSPEFVVKEFCDKLNGDELAGSADLFSSKARGKAKTIREGKAGESMTADLKSALANPQVIATKQIQRRHLVVIESSSSAAGGNAPAGNAAGGGRQRKGRSKSKKVQFKIVDEGGKLVIEDIVIN